VNYQQDDWLDLLSQAEFAYDNTTHASTGISPFFANYGFHPRFSLEIPKDSINPSAERKGHEAWIGSTKPYGRTQANTRVAKEVSRPSTQGPSKLQGWRQGLASQKKHCYHLPMCQVGLQTPQTFQNRQIGWSSGLPVGASTPVQNPQCFPCLLA
jgi:hypothetical protein